MKVLIVEDNPVTTVLLTEQLSAWGYEPITTNRAKYALVEINNHSDVQLIIMDWQLPDGDGAELCRKLKSVTQRFFYIVMVTSQSDQRSIVAALNKGADDFVAKPFMSDELRARLNVGRRIVSMERRLEELANKDTLTGISNRRVILEQLHQEFNRAQRQQSSFALLVVDIDDFKRINDSHGHLVGDKALKHVVAAIAGALRPYDKFGRLGGEEFLIVLPSIESETAMVAAERIRQAVCNAPFSYTDNQSLVITISIGASRFTLNDTCFNDILKRADDAVYESKRLGRDCVTVA